MIPVMQDGSLFLIPGDSRGFPVIQTRNTVMNLQVAWMKPGGFCAGIQLLYEWIHGFRT
jgi:hypothetical protein